MTDLGGSVATSRASSASAVAMIGGLADVMRPIRTAGQLADVIRPIGAAAALTSITAIGDAMRPVRTAGQLADVIRPIGAAAALTTITAIGDAMRPIHTTNLIADAIRPVRITGIGDAVRITGIGDILRPIGAAGAITRLAEIDALETLWNAEPGTYIETYDLRDLTTSEMRAAVLTTVWLLTFSGMIVLVLNAYEVSDAVGTVTGASSMWIADRIRQLAAWLLDQLPTE